jgi:hypothetical protein
MTPPNVALPLNEPFGPLEKLLEVMPVGIDCPKAAAAVTRSIANKK